MFISDPLPEVHVFGCPRGVAGGNPDSRLLANVQIDERLFLMTAVFGPEELAVKRKLCPSGPNEARHSLVRLIEVAQDLRTGRRLCCISSSMTYFVVKLEQDFIEVGDAEVLLVRHQGGQRISASVRIFVDVAGGLHSGQGSAQGQMFKSPHMSPRFSPAVLKST